MAWRFLCGKFGPTVSLVTVVDGVIVALVWEYDGSKCFAFFFRLAAHAEATRIHQLRHATRWANENVSSADIVVFAGIGILFAPILKSGAARRQCGDHPCA